MTFTYNPYRQLLGLLPSSPLQVGDVLSVSNGVATLELPDGGQVTARGNVTTGDRVFFKDGVIEGAAPNLTFVSVDV